MTAEKAEGCASCQNGKNNFELWSRPKWSAEKVELAMPTDCWLSPANWGLRGGFGAGFFFPFSSRRSASASAATACKWVAQKPDCFNCFVCFEWQKPPSTLWGQPTQGQTPTHPGAHTTKGQAERQRLRFSWEIWSIRHVRRGAEDNLFNTLYASSNIQL